MVEIIATYKVQLSGFSQTSIHDLKIFSPLRQYINLKYCHINSFYISRLIIDSITCIVLLQNQ